MASSTCAASATATRWRLLNGSPLPSPEPMRRAVPLDLFPTDVIASSLVQKTYSPNFSGEFGGGVINLTTLSAPKTPFFSASVGMSGDTETTGNLGYDYYGGEHDWTGYDSGLRDLTPALEDFFASGEPISSGTVDTNEIAKGLVTPQNALVQQIDSVPFNWSANVSAGDAWSVGDNDSRHRPDRHGWIQQHLAHARQHRTNARQRRPVRHRQGLSPRRHRQPCGDQRHARA